MSSPTCLSSLVGVCSGIDVYSPHTFIESCIGVVYVVTLVFIVPHTGDLFIKSCRCEYVLHIIYIVRLVDRVL